MARATNARRRRGTRAATMKGSARKQRRMIQRTSAGSVKMCEDFGTFFCWVYLYLLFAPGDWNLTGRYPELHGIMYVYAHYFKALPNKLYVLNEVGHYSCVALIITGFPELQRISNIYIYIETETQRCFFLQDLSTHWNPMHPNTSWVVPRNTFSAGDWMSGGKWTHVPSLLEARWSSKTFTSKLRWAW